MSLGLPVARSEGAIRSASAPLETVTPEETLETMEISGLFLDQRFLANEVSLNMGFRSLCRVFTNDLEQLTLRGAGNLLDPDYLFRDISK